MALLEDPNGGVQARRREAEVSLLPGTDDCILTSSVATFSESEATSTAFGTMFSVTARGQDIEVLTLELSIRGPEAVNIEIYTSSDEDFVSVSNVPEEWNLVATSTVLPREAGTTIVPVADFTPVTIEAHGTKSFYVTTQSRNLLVSRNELVDQVGQILVADQSMQINAGIILFGYPFPSNFNELHNMDGAVHYRTSLPCNLAQEVTLVPLEYNVEIELRSIGQDVGPSIVTIIENTLGGLLDVDGDLLNFKSFHDLELQGASYGAEIDGACPIEWQACSKATVSLVFTHHHSLAPGQVTRAVLKNEPAFSSSVAENLHVNSQYGGSFPVQADLLITLVGVAPNTTMDYVQQSYFEKVTTDFLSSRATTQEILDADVNEQLVASEGNIPTSSRRLQHLRGGSRQMQDGGTTIVVGTTVYGATRGTSVDFVLEVLTTFADSDREYALDLSTNILLPGKVNEGGRDEFFSGVYGTSVRYGDGTWGPYSHTAIPSLTPSSESESRPAGESSSASSVAFLGLSRNSTIATCVSLILASALWLCCFHRTHQKALKSERRKKARKALLRSLGLSEDDSDISLASELQGEKLTSTELTNSSKHSRNSEQKRNASTHSRDRSSRHSRRLSPSSRHSRGSEHNSREDRSSHSRHGNSSHRKERNTSHHSSRHRSSHRSERSLSHRSERNRSSHRSERSLSHRSERSSSHRSETSGSSHRRERSRGSIHSHKKGETSEPEHQIVDSKHATPAFYVSSSMFMEDDSDGDDSYSGVKHQRQQRGTEVFGKTSPHEDEKGNDASFELFPPQHDRYKDGLSRSDHARGTKSCDGLSKSDHVHSSRSKSFDSLSKSDHVRDGNSTRRSMDGLSKSDHVRHSSGRSSSRELSKSDHVRRNKSKSGNASTKSNHVRSSRDRRRSCGDLSQSDHVRGSKSTRSLSQSDHVRGSKSSRSLSKSDHIRGSRSRSRSLDGSSKHTRGRNTSRDGSTKSGHARKSRGRSRSRDRLSQSDHVRRSKSKSRHGLSKSEHVRSSNSRDRTRSRSASGKLKSRNKSRHERSRHKCDDHEPQSNHSIERSQRSRSRHERHHDGKSKSRRSRDCGDNRSRSKHSRGDSSGRGERGLLSRAKSTSSVPVGNTSMKRPSSRREGEPSNDRPKIERSKSVDVELMTSDSVREGSRHKRNGSSTHRERSSIRRAKSHSSVTKGGADEHSTSQEREPHQGRIPSPPF